MKHARSLLLAASTLTFLVSACSQPADIQTPTLIPQFGGADDDFGAAVALTTTGQALVLSEQAGNNTANDHESDVYESVLVKRYDSSGKLLLNKTLATQACDYNEQNCDNNGLIAWSIHAGFGGYSHALVSSTFVAGDAYDMAQHYVYKLDANGNVVTKLSVGASGSNFDGDFAGNNVVTMTTDDRGNIYVAHRQFDLDYDTFSGTYTNFTTKYSSNGVKLWQRTSAVGIPMDITVSSSGSVYVVGTKGVARYTNSGNLTWTKPGNFEQVMISGSNLYTRYRKDIRKYDGNGKQLWLKTQGGLKTLVLQDMVGDGNGNIYLSGKYQVSGLNWNAMTRKLNSSGSVLWTKTYGTPAYDDAKGIATINGSEIYTTGLTRGSLAHTHKGGEDGYIRKLNSTGNPLWTR